MNAMEIANTILQQIKTLTPMSVFFSWGATEFKSIKSNQVAMNHPYLGALCFYAHGRVHEGHVIITLAPNDTYTISTGHLCNGEFKVKEQKTDIYVDMLSETLDEMIETPMQQVG